MVSVIKDVLAQAEQAVMQRCDKISDPLFDTPNHPNIRGMLRWVMVQKHLEIAVTNKQFDGVTSHWVDLGGVWRFELHTKHTRVTPCHLLDENDTPKCTVYFQDSTIQNQVNPLLTGFEAESQIFTDGLLNILLVHGGKKNAFAFLRAYADPLEKGNYHSLSKNIMELPELVSGLDNEIVATPVPTLKKPGLPDKEILTTEITDESAKNEHSVS